MISEDKKGEDEVSSTNRLNETGDEEVAPDTSMDSLQEAGQGDNSVVSSTSSHALTKRYLFTKCSFKNMLELLEVIL